MAVHMQDILEQIENVLTCYEPTSVSQLDNDCLCFMHSGKIEILSHPYTDCLFAIPLKYFYIVDINSDNTVTKRGINLKEVNEFTKSLVCESMYDWEYACDCSCHESLRKFQPKTWIDGSRLNETAQGYMWWEKYHKIAHNEFVDLFQHIERETEIQGIHLYFLKDYLLEKIYGISGYMPKRYDEYKYDYDSIYSQQITDDKIDELIDRGLKLKHNLTYYVTRALPEHNLFSEALVEDVVKHIMNVFVSYHYFSLGKVLVVKHDTN
ncbi:MAG: hypothetical protein NC453_13190 [Muribaculum sp.]|nr:hypothetical protein [Muribaculum sp.]